METANKTQKVVFLKGMYTILRPMNKETDLEKCVRWINDPDVWKYLAHYKPNTIEMEAEWFNSLSKNDSNIVLAIEAIISKNESEFIGVMGIHKIDWKNRVATTGAFIGEKEYWGKGYGTDAKMTLLNYLFNELGMHKVSSSVITYNKRSLQYSLHCGYKIEGVLKEQKFRNGRYWDEILLGVFRKNWLPIWKKYQKAGKV